MKIAIDVSSVVYGTGVSVYTKNLVENLLKTDKKNEYVLFGGSLRRGREIKNFYNNLKATSFEGRVWPIPPTAADFIWNKVHRLSIEKLIGKVDVFHSSDWTQPPSKAFKITTIHDLTPLLFPSLSHPRIVSTHKSRLKWVVKEVDRVIVPSKTTAIDVANLGVKQHKIKVIPEAVDPIFKPASKDSMAKVKEKYGITGDYILAIGINERKNTFRIIEAYKKIKSKTGLKLIIVGYAHSGFEEIEGILFTGHVPTHDLPPLYSASKALVYPSLYEGFGLPILEAYACGTPVVTSNMGSMAELAGEVAVLVDPKSTESISKGIEVAVKNRQYYVGKGFIAVGKYSWEKAAKATLSLYHEAL